MNSRSRAAMTSTNPLVQAALQEYVDRVDRGEAIDVAAFVVQHADVADELRSFIALDLEARRLAGGATPVVRSPLSKAPAVKPLPTNAEVSTHSIVGSIEGTVGGKPKSAGPQAASASVEKSTGDLPDVFGRYRVQKKLGSGAMGAVYLADDTLLHRKVALKTPTFDDDKDGELLRRFYREARAVANLKHPNLCAVYDVGEIDGRHYISMEFVRGKKLQDYIKPDKPMPEKQAMAVVRKIALAMHESHTHGVIHRDLKPDNIMVNEKGEPVVMDFGLVYRTESKNSTRITQRGMLVGSPAYMSKEQVEGDPDKLTAATDQYSLGVILYQLLTSKLPFEGGIHAVLASILTKEPSPPCQFREDLNRHLEAVCLKMMAKEAKDRYPSMKAVADAIAEVAKATSKAGGSVVVPAPVEGSMTDGFTATFAGFSVATEKSLPSLSVTKSVVKGRARRPIKKRSNSLLYTVVAAAALLLLLSVIVWIRSGNALVKISVHVDDVEVTFQNETLTLVDGTHEYKVVPGEHVLHIKLKDADFDTDKFTLKRGENPVVTVEIVDAEIVTKLGNEVISRISLQPFAPADSVVFQDKRFKLFAEQLTWHEAQRKCRAMGGRVAEVRSSTENDFLMKLASDAKQTGIWLGATDEVQQGTWLWSDDSGLAFNYFANGQPDRRTTGRHYLLMMIRSQRGQWCSQPDRSVEWTPGFICEWDNDDRGKSPLAASARAIESEAWTELFNGHDLAGWVDSARGTPAAWKVQENYMEATLGVSIMTAKTFPLDFQLHAEFWIPKEDGKSGQGRGNSGIFLLGRHEIQILDMFENPGNPAQIAGLGALFNSIAPQGVVIRPPETWQAFDIKFHAPRADATGKKSFGHLTVSHDGKVVIDNAAITEDFSAGAQNKDFGNPGPILLQGHVSPVRFRRIRIRELPPLEAADASDATPEPVSDLDRVAVGNWRPLIEATTVLTDPQHMKFQDGILELDTVPMNFQSIVARDVVVRAEVRNISGENVTIGLRNAIDTEQKTRKYGAFFAGTEYLGGDFFGIKKIQGDTPWINLNGQRIGRKFESDQFVEMAFSAVGHVLTLYVEGREVLSTRNNEYGQGFISLNAHHGVGLFRNVEYQILDPRPESDSASSEPDAQEGIAAIPADAVAFENKRFKLFTEQLTWHEAMNRCQQMGGRLAEVRSVDENDFLTNMVRGNGPDGVWLGASDQTKFGNWVWSDGSALTYGNWAAKQPNNFGGEEHYVMLLVSDNNGQWWDQPDISGLGLPKGWKTGYICEWDAIRQLSSKDFTTTSSGLMYRVLRDAAGRKPAATSTVTVNYKGWLDSGVVFDSVHERGAPISLALDSNMIKGFAEGMQLVGEGGMIELEIPSYLGYGNKRVVPAIPPNSTLHFTIELLKVTSPD